MMIRILLGVIFLFMYGCVPTKNYLPNEITTQFKTVDGVVIEKLDVSTLMSTDYKGSAKKDDRNEIIAIGITLSDKACANHKAQIISDAANWNLSTGSIAMIFAGAAAVIDSATTASHLAAGAATLTGVQSLANNEVYANALSTTILRAIDVSRSKARAKLLNGMENDNYSISLALIDLQEYHDACSLMSGLVEVTKALENRKPSTDELDLQITHLRKSISALTSTDPALVNPPTNPPVNPPRTQQLDVQPRVSPDIIKKLQELQAEKIQERAETLE